MSIPTRPPNDPPRPLSDEQMEHLLSAFFRAELPRPWPEARLPFATRPLAASSRNGMPALTASRLSLAASVAVLIGTCWYLSTSIPKSGGSSAGPSGLLRESEATVPADRQPMNDIIPMRP